MDMFGEIKDIFERAAQAKAPPRSPLNAEQQERLRDLYAARDAIGREIYALEGALYAEDTLAAFGVKE